MNSADNLTPEKDNMAETIKVEGEETPQCIMLKRVICAGPLPMITLFWKVTIGVSAVLLLAITLTLWGLTAAVNSDRRERREEKTAELAAIQKVLETVQVHQHNTMENRVVQSEILGILRSWIAERRQITTDIEKKLDKLDRRK
jgi:hypothetical protein